MAIPLPIVNEVGDLENPGMVEIVQSAVISHANGTASKCVNVFHYHQDRAFPGVLPTKASILAGFIANVETPLLTAVASATYGSIHIGLRWVDNPVDSFDDNTVGDAVGSDDTLPAFNCVVFNLRSDFRGGKYRGKKFFAGVRENLTQNCELSTLTVWSNVGIGLRTNIVDNAGNQWFPVILSRSTSDLTASPALMSYVPVTSVQLNKNIGKMTRRKQVRDFVVV